MCSISGIIGISEFETTAIVERMNAALRHRGPDDAGVSSFEFQAADASARGALGNTRLAIIDLSPAGHQPMQDKDSGLTITYNGEIYNFRELRSEIGDAFGPWQSNTDTEVVLRAYRYWGVAAFAKLRGMFACAIWDQQKQELVLARDRFGIKPLYYADGIQQTADGSNNFLFASEVRALLATGLVERKLSPRGLASYLEYGSIQSPLTIVEGVQSLLPGHYLTIQVTNNGLEVSDREFATLTTDTERPPKGKRADAVAELKDKLAESVRVHLVSDVPLGVFLSGGMDSSALVALMSRVTGDKPKTFSVVFAEAKFSEAPHSRLVAEKFCTEHQEIHLSEDQLLAMLPDALAAMDQPTMDGVNTFVVSKAVKDAGVTVALSGLGGDELFAGYSTFRRAVRLGGMSQIARGLIRSAARFSKNQSNGSVRRKKFWQLAQSDGSATSVYEISRQLFSAEQADKLASFEFRVPALLGRSHRVAASGSNALNSNPDPINDMSLLELHGYTTNTLLRDTDFMSMAHSLEVRVPFVDNDVVNFVLGLPGQWKINGGRPKPLLADVVSDLLPTEFLERSKMGFTLPFEKWMRVGLRDEIANVFRDEKQLAQCGLDAETAASVWDSFQRTPTSTGWSRPWSLYVLAKWCEINNVVAGEVKSEE
jgi:asparagine synthase (glutamine-hydrolysing)